MVRSKSEYFELFEKWNQLVWNHEDSEGQLEDCHFDSLATGFALALGFSHEESLMFAIYHDKLYSDWEVLYKEITVLWNN